MYWNLIDTVSTIVTTYGIGILSRPQFWYVLTDSYPFASDYSLKSTFKNCIDSGYLSNLIIFKGNYNKTISEIIRLIDHERRVHTDKEQEYAAVLYSIAIAIGSCSKKDYTDFLNQGHPSHQPIIDVPPALPSIQNELIQNESKGKYNFGVFMSTVWGLITLWGSTLLYSTFLNYPQMSMSMIAICLGVFQLSFCAFTLNIFQNKHFKWNKTTEANAIWSYMPIMIGFLINDLIPFLFYSDSIRKYLSHRVWNSDQAIEVPGGFGIFLIVMLLFSIFSCAWGLYSNYGMSQPRAQLRKKPFLIVSVIALSGCVGLYHALVG